MDQPVDHSRRQFLARLTTLMGAAGICAAGIPFVASFHPSRRTIIAGKPVSVKVGQMKPGDQLTVMWRGKPIWIIKRSQEMLKALAQMNVDQLRDPDSKIVQQPSYAQNKYRSREPDFLVLVGVCTHLGCAPTYRPEPGSVSEKWPGGFFCSCHGSTFDLAGRVYKGVPAPINLEVPPYVFVSPDEILIGADQPEKE